MKGVNASDVEHTLPVTKECAHECQVGIYNATPFKGAKTSKKVRETQIKLTSVPL